MPVVPFIPLIAAGVGTAGSVYAANKSANAAKLDPTTLGYQNEALKLKNQRMKMLDPLYQQLVGAASNRMAGGGTPAPSIGQMQSPYAGQAVSQLARALPAPQAGRKRIIWGD